MKVQSKRPIAASWHAPVYRRGQQSTRSWVPDPIQALGSYKPVLNLNLALVRRDLFGVSLDYDRLAG